jgi:hypothetical protein
MSWSFVHPVSHLVLSVAALLFLATLAFVVPTIIALRRRTATEAIAWADVPQREAGAAWATDRVLRSVEASCRAAGVGFPGFVRAVVGTGVRLDLASPTVAPPEPWSTTPDGRSWSAPMWALQAIPLTAAPSTGFATVVGLGGDADGAVLVDLRQVGGFVALGGDATARTAVARRITDQVRTDPWSVGTTVLTVGVADGTLGAASSVSVAEAVAAVTADATPGLLVVREVPGGADGRELARLLERPGGRWAGLSLRPSSLARWTLDCRRDGTLVSDELGTVRWMDLALTAPLGAPSADVDGVAPVAVGVAPVAAVGEARA